MSFQFFLSMRRILVYLLLITSYSQAKGINDPRLGSLRPISLPSAHVIPPNGLGEAQVELVSDYDSLLEQVSGDFGVKSQVLISATDEPEYKGAHTLVLPLYIPRGAVPIRVARITRSGKKSESKDTTDVNIVDFAIAPHPDRILVRRLGSISPRIQRPKRPSWRITSDDVLLPRFTLKNSNESVSNDGNATTTTEAPVSTSTARARNWSQRLRRPVSSPLASEDDEESFQEGSFRSKKNELSKHSQFPNKTKEVLGSADLDSRNRSIPSSDDASVKNLTFPKIVFPKSFNLSHKTTPATSSVPPKESRTSYKLFLRTTTPPTITTTQSLKHPSGQAPLLLTSIEGKGIPLIRRPPLIEQKTRKRLGPSTTTAASSVPADPKITTPRSLVTTVFYNLKISSADILSPPHPLIKRPPRIQRPSTTTQGPTTSDEVRSSEKTTRDGNEGAEENDETHERKLPLLSLLHENENLDKKQKATQNETDHFNKTKLGKVSKRLIERKPINLDTETDLNSNHHKLIENLNPQIAKLFPHSFQSTNKVSTTTTKPIRRRRPVVRNRKTTSIPETSTQALLTVSPLGKTNKLKIRLETSDSSSKVAETLRIPDNEKVSNASTQDLILTTLSPLPSNKDKNPETLVIERLTKIMKGATSGNKVSIQNITTALEVLNDDLASSGIHIICAEIDGQQIKLDQNLLNKTLFRDVGQTTYRPTGAFPLGVPTLHTKAGFKLDHASHPSEEPSRSIHTSFSYKTSTTHEENLEKESVNEVESTSITKDIVQTTVKSTDKAPGANTHLVSLNYDENSKGTLPFSSMDTSSSHLGIDIRAPIPVVGGNYDHGQDFEPFNIHPTSTFNPGTTTRTRSTAIFVTTAEPSPDASSNSSRYLDSDAIKERTVHPTSHSRPKGIQKVSTDIIEDIEVYDIRFKYDIESNPLEESFDDEESSRKQNDFKILTNWDTISPNETSIEATGNEEEDLQSNLTTESSSSNLSMIAFIAVVPVALVTAILIKKYLKGDRKALPENEIRGDGFSPVTHHSRKIRRDSFFDFDPPSLEMPDPKSSSRELSKSKLCFLSVLGEGHFGIVWKAEVQGLCDNESIPVAVKGVKEGAGAKEKEDLLKELAIMEHLREHANVVTLLGCCTQQEPYFVVMEYVKFGKLLTYLREHRSDRRYANFSSDAEVLTARDLTRFAFQVSTGCDYLQSRGIIHRDLAARNILVSHNKVCKIADFGLARNVRDLDSDIYEQKSRGPLPIRWMAPESLFMSIFTHKSDVWSFAILSWEIVTLGSTPYSSLSAREVMKRVSKGFRLPRPNHCRPELYRIVAKCWHQDLNKRPSFSELKVELGELLDSHLTYLDLDNFSESAYFSINENNDEKL